MFGFGNNNEALNKELTAEKVKVNNFSAAFAAINRAMAVIEFNPDGTIITANDNFLSTVGYQLNEIQNKHHRIFCLPEYTKTTEYADFWRELNNGQYLSGQFERIKKDKSSIWLEASYNPVFDNDNKLIKIIKFASDISERIAQAKEKESIIKAISHSMAVIEFELDGTIITANDNFLNTTLYTLNEIQGQHHKIFCENSLSNSGEYAQFWSSLNRGEYQSGQYKRIDKQNNVLWLEASYNPIFDSSGQLTKVVKFATDITSKVNNVNDAREIAAKTSISADDSAQRGTEIVKSTVTLMSDLTQGVSQACQSLDDLGKQADKINDIVNTISGIADQTNLLALNAAIEAARAGEQGRGFAVVADEVRQLAARTSSSTTEIAEVVKKNLDLSEQATNSMEQSTEQLNHGRDLVAQLNTTIEEINAGVAAIGAAIEQQSN